jgi:hypothetical protein
MDNEHRKLGGSFLDIERWEAGNENEGSTRHGRQKKQIKISASHPPLPQIS